MQARFAAFVAAQNAHDLEAVRATLYDGPAFVWVTRGAVVQGPQAALERFGRLYQGTWRLEPTGAARTIVIDPDTVQLIAPVTFRIGAPGETPVETPFLLTQLWRRAGRGDWRIVSLLPIPAPPSR